MKDEEKAKKIAREKSQSYGFGLNYEYAVERVEWKDRESKIMFYTHIQVNKR